MSCAREDIDIAERLQVVLRPLVREGRLEIWVDTAIRPSSRWHDETDRARRDAVPPHIVLSDKYLRA